MFLPGSQYYDLLSTLPAPDPTTSSASPAYPVQLIMHTEKVPHAVELMKLCEEQDEEDIESTFQKQKGTLEAVKMGISVFKGHVAAKVLISSPVWSVYQYILAYAQDDTLRRDVEAKELRYYYRITVSLPPSGPHARKEHQEHTRAKTLELARGMVTLGVPDELAWRVFLEWTDAPLARLPYDELRRYVQLFPSAGRAYAFRALLRLVKDQAYLQDCTEAGPERVAEEHDLLQLALDGYEKMKDSTLCARILSLFYLLDRDYTSALDVLLHAHARQRALSTSTGVDTPRVNAEVAAQLATLYAHLHAPKHHAEAWQLATEVLEHQPHQIDALLVKAYVQEARREWKAARQGFQQVMSQPLGASTSYGRNLSALYLSADYHLEAEAAYTRTLVEMGEYEDARHALDSLLERCDHESNVFGAEFRARLWYERGRCLWSLGGEYRTAPEHAYQCFIESIKRFATYAPAFTALGEYYETAVSPPDMVRASKCYQRAFELDATEYEAGRHLVEHFAAQREWGLVDVIARRVAEAEGGAEVLSGQATTAHVTSNAWVWKAIGIVEAQNQHADAAIAAFQVALRASPRDADLWTRLGEAYVASGRPIAALKTYKRALSLQPPSDDAWHLYYDMAEVHRRLGRYEVALELLERVQVMAPPSQHGVRVVLAETRLAHARFLLGGGHIHRALLALHQAIDDAAKTLHADALLSTAWKVVADACFLLAKMDVALPRDDDAAESTPASLAATLESLVLLLDQQDVDNRLAAVSVVKASDLASADLSSRSWQAQEYLEHAAAVYKYLAVLQGQNAAAGVWAWADLATALCRLSWLWSSPAVLARAAAQGEDEDALSLRAQQARLQALECTQLALQLKPQARLWLLQGNLHFGKNMVLAQHAYIMAIEANPKSPVPWTNLGFLYLDVNDLALAEEAFVRAQTMAPDWPASWLGAALVHERHGAKPRSYARLWEQACVLSDGALLEADYGFALAVWDHAHGGGHVPRVRMLAPLLALQRYLAQRPQDDAALHLSALVAEQQGGAAMAVHRIERASAVLEAEYEATESSVTAMHYGLASMNLARIRLANTDAAGAMEAVESALALMEDEESVSSITARAWCTLYQGQAQFMAGEREAGVEALRTLLLSLPDVEMDDGQRRALHACAAVWLARMLWTQGASMADMEHVLDTAYVCPLTPGSSTHRRMGCLLLRVPRCALPWARPTSTIRCWPSTLPAFLQRCRRRCGMRRRRPCSACCTWPPCLICPRCSSSLHARTRATTALQR